MNVSISSGALWAHIQAYTQGEAIPLALRLSVGPIEFRSLESISYTLPPTNHHAIACLVERQYPLGIAVVGSPLGFPNLAPVVPGCFGALIRLESLSRL